MELKSDHKDIFDRIMDLAPFRRFAPMYKKHKRVLLYLFFGALAYAVSMTSYWALNIRLGIDALIANVLSWVITVSFAFVTNKTWVFSAHADGANSLLRQLTSFFGGRVVTLLIEEAILAVFITWLGLNSMLVKAAAQLIVIVLNYIISKVFVFRHRKSKI